MFNTIPTNIVEGLDERIYAEIELKKAYEDLEDPSISNEMKGAIADYILVLENSLTKTPPHYEVIE